MIDMEKSSKRSTSFRRNKHPDSWILDVINEAKQAGKNFVEVESLTLSQDTISSLSSCGYYVTKETRRHSRIWWN